MITSMTVFLVGILACSLVGGTKGSTGVVELPEELESPAGAVELLSAEEFEEFAASAAALAALAFLTL